MHFRFIARQYGHAIVIWQFCPAMSLFVSRRPNILSYFLQYIVATSFPSSKHVCDILTRLPPMGLFNTGELNKFCDFVLLPPRVWKMFSPVKNSPLKNCLWNLCLQQWLPPPVLHIFVPHENVAPHEKFSPVNLWLWRELTHDTHKHDMLIGNLLLSLCVHSWCVIANFVVCFLHFNRKLVTWLFA